MTEPWGFPFAAVVGYDDAKLALLLAAAEPRLGGVLLRGDKGTAKTTLARGLAALRPSAPFVELPLGATEDRVVGAVDVGAALDGAGWQIRPGLLAQADGGVLYVDEINLLAGHLVDVLLDAAATGTGRVERDGLSHTYPARFTLVGSMNPEEGELRPQLLDRFALVVDIGGQPDVAQRAEAVRRRLAHDIDPIAFSSAWSGAGEALRADLQRAAGAEADLPGEVIERASALCTELGIETLRADLTLCRAATALARLQGDRTVTDAHLEAVAPIALAHRRRRGPFDDGRLDAGEVHDALDRVQPPPSPSGSGRDSCSDGTEIPPSSSGEAPADPPDPPEVPADPVVTGPLHLDARAAEPIPRQPVPATRPAARPRPDRTSTGAPTGPAVGARLPRDPRQPDGIAPAATVLAGVTRRLTGHDEPVLAPDDVREPVRRPETSRTVVVGLDTSASMGAEARIGAARDAVLAVLLDAYQRRERVALVAIGGEEPRVILQPTSSVEVARARLAGLAPAGPTPLAAGLTAAAAVAAQARDDGDEALLVLITDGRATAAPDGRPPLDAALAAAGEVAAQGLPTVVLDAEPAAGGLLLAAQLADRLQARHLRLDELTAARVEQALRMAPSVAG